MTLFKASIFAVLSFVTLASAAKASGESHVNNYYTSLNFGRTFEGKAVKAVVAHLYVLAKHSEPTMPLAQQGDVYVVLKDAGIYFTGKGLTVGSGYESSGPSLRIVGPFVDYQLEFEDGSRLTTEAFPVPVKTEFSYQSSRYNMPEVDKEMLAALKAFNRYADNKTTAVLMGSFQ